MELNQLKIFTAVYRNRSFTKAASELRLSQPTVSEHIKNLEGALGCRLFDRVSRRILPTREAEILYPEAIHIVEEADQLQERVRSSGGQIGGSLVVGVSTIPGSYILPQRAVAFPQQYPDVSFEILIDDSRRITDRVLNHELLVGIVGAVMEPDRLNDRPVFEDELILVAPGHGR
jgi:DNA-binding transcriptional LysR family regulator